MKSVFFSSMNEINILNIVFSCLNNKNTNGGAVFIQDDSIDVIIDYCTIFKCSSSFQGGGIFSNSNKALLRCLCLSYCTCFDNFISLISEANSESANTFIYSTIFKSTSTKPYTCSIKDGIQSISYINSTCNADEASGLMIYFSKTSSQSSYCSLINNQANNGQILENSDSLSSSMSNYNIINNSALNGPHGIVSIWRGSATLTKSTLIDNKEFKCLFYFDQGTLNVNFCYIQETDENSKTNDDNVLVINEDFKYVNEIKFFQTFSCMAEVFSTGILPLTFEFGTLTLPTKIFNEFWSCKAINQNQINNNQLIYVNLFIIITINK